MNIFEKDFNEITVEDLTELILEKIPEDESLEYKKTLSSKNGEDKWITGSTSVGDKAIINLVKEIVAFANTSGGFVILGMEESDDIRPVAKNINSIPRIIELSEKLKASFRHIIEPTLNNIKYNPIIIENGNGVLIIKVERSQNAPHRSLKDKECYFRRNDSSEKMSMREIKDVTLSRFNSNENINKIFLERKQGFEKNFQAKKLPFNYSKEINNDRIGIRFTFIPTNDGIYLPNLFNYLSMEDVHTKEINIKFGEEAKNYQLNFPFYSPEKNAIIRGVRFIRDIYNAEIYQDGLIEVTLVIEKSLGREPILYLDWFLRLFYHGVKALEKIKTDLLNNEFYFETEIISSESEFKAKTFSESPLSTKIINSQNIIFPRYSYSGLDDIDLISKTLVQDFYGMCEAYFSYDLIINPSEIIKGN